MNFTRGITAGLIGALVGGLGIPLAFLLYLFVSWQLTDANRVVRSDGLLDLRSAVHSYMGAAIYLGLTAFATYTPKRYFGFAKTLSILFVGGILSHVLISQILFPRNRLRTNVYSDDLLSEFLVMLGPPLLIACGLIIWRRGAKVSVDG